MAASRFTRPPCGFVALGLVARVMMFTPWTTILPDLGMARITSPVLPLSLPETITTVSPLRTCNRTGSFFVIILENLRRQRDDLHVVLFPQFPGDGPENPGPTGV